MTEVLVLREEKVQVESSDVIRSVMLFNNSVDSMESASRSLELFLAQYWVLMIWRASTVRVSIIWLRSEIIYTQWTTWKLWMYSCCGLHVRTRLNCLQTNIDSCEQMIWGKPGSNIRLTLFRSDLQALLKLKTKQRRTGLTAWQAQGCENVWTLGQTARSHLHLGPSQALVT